MLVDVNVTLANAVQFLNAEPLMVVTLVGLVMLVKPLLSNALDPIEVTPLPIVMRVNFVHPLKALEPIEVILLDIVTFVKEVQPSKADALIEVMPPKEETVVKLDLLNAYDPIEVIELGNEMLVNELSANA